MGSIQQPQCRCCQVVRAGAGKNLYTHLTCVREELYLVVLKKAQGSFKYKLLEKVDGSITTIVQTRRK